MLAVFQNLRWNSNKTSLLTIFILNSKEHLKNIREKQRELEENKYKVDILSENFKNKLNKDKSKHTKNTKVISDRKAIILKEKKKGSDGDENTGIEVVKSSSPKDNKLLDTQTYFCV